MKFINAVTAFYIFYLILILVAPLKTSLIDLFFGYLFSLYVVFAFFLGMKIRFGKKKSIDKKAGRVSGLIKISALTKMYLCISGFLSIPIAIYVANYYTGLMPTEVFIGIFIDSKSTYNSYQQYFLANNLGTFSVFKVIPILLSFLLKLNLILWFYVLFFASNREVRRFLFYLNFLMCFISYIYFSLSRGTSFEFFEILVLGCLIIFLKSSSGLLGIIFSKSFLKLTVIALIFLAVYSINISLRYGDSEVDNCISINHCYDQSSIYPASFGLLLYKLSGYFTFGFYYLSVFISEYFNSINTMILMPLNDLQTGRVERGLCSVILDCQTMWAPSLEIWILNLGMVFLFFVVFIFGLFTRIVYINFLNNTGFVNFCFLFVIFLQVISFPIGNFLFNSSANVLVLLSSILFILFSGLCRGTLIEDINNK